MREPSRRLTSTSGGSRETDMKAVAVMPTSSPPGAVRVVRVERRLLRGHQDHARGQPGHGGAELVVAHPLSMPGGGRRKRAGDGGEEGVFGTPETLISVPRAPHRASARAGT